MPFYAALKIYNMFTVINMLNELENNLHLNGSSWCPFNPLWWGKVIHNGCNQDKTNPLVKDLNNQLLWRSFTKFVLSIWSRKKIEPGGDIYTFPDFLFARLVEEEQLKEM